jgi:hypothetical protein
MNTCDGSRIWYSPAIGVMVSEAKVALSIVERSHQQIARLEVHGRMKGPWWTFSEAGCALLYIDELVSLQHRLYVGARPQERALSHPS